MKSNNRGHRQHLSDVLYTSLNTAVIGRDVCGVNSIIVNCVGLGSDIRWRDSWAAVAVGGFLQVDIASSYHSDRWRGKIGADR